MEYMQNNLNNQIEEYQKALRNLETELQKKEYEISTITNSYQELKKLNINLSKECENLSEKNISLITEKQELEKKHELEINTLNSNFKKKETEYQTKISNFSSFNANSFKNKIESDLMNQYEEKLISKDQEILELNQLVDKLNKDNELISAQFQFEKEGLLKDMNTLKNLQKTETLDLLQRIQILKNDNKKYINSVDNEQFLRVKNELENSKHQINILSKENITLKKNNEILIREKNKLKSELLVLDGNKQFEEKKNETEIKRLNNYVDNLKQENNILKNDNQRKDNEIKKLYNEKINLSNQFSNKELECQQLLNEVNILNDLLKTHQEDYENNLIQNYKNKKESQLKERLNEEKYKSEIEDLKFKLKNKKNLEEIDEIINDKDREINKLKKKIFEIENNNLNSGNLRKQYNDIVKKKNFYKKQCKETNEKIEKLLKKLGPEQEKEFKNLFDINNINSNSN